MRVGKFRWPLAFVVGATAVVLALWQSIPGVETQAEEIEARRDHFRILGKVEFDGERILYDEIIQVRMDVGTTSTMGLKKGDNRTSMSRLWIARKLRTGGALLMEVPDAAGLFTDLERVGEPPDPAWSPSNVRDFLRPPPEFLPLFFWVDDAESPSVMEGYVSEAYYEQANARLRLLDPIRIEFVPPTKEAEKIAWAQAHAEPQVNLYAPGEYNGAWNGIRVLKVSRDQWTQCDVSPVSHPAEGRVSP